MKANSRAPISIAAPATATVFLLVSLSKMPRSSNGGEGLATRIRPEAFPIKANDYTSMWSKLGRFRVKLAILRQPARR